MSKAKPRIGDTVEYNGYIGIVDWVGSAQFAFNDENAEVTQQNGTKTKGFRLQVLFNQEFKVVKRKPVSKRDIKKKIQAKKQRVSGGVHNRRKRRRKPTRNSTE